MAPPLRPSRAPRLRPLSYLMALTTVGALKRTRRSHAMSPSSGLLTGGLAINSPRWPDMQIDGDGW
eukprot:9099753-Alexandrium_andersonii.AAC.1